jgi:hypothetical protein
MGARNPMVFPISFLHSSSIKEKQTLQLFADQLLQMTPKKRSNSICQTKTTQKLNTLPISYYDAVNRTTRALY